MISRKFQEISEEFSQVVGRNPRIVDLVVPPLTFILLNSQFHFDVALAGSGIIAILIAIFRLWRAQPVRFAFGGLLSVAFAFLLARWYDRAEAFFLPGILTSGLTVILILVSLLIGKPVVAWTSHIARRWPLDWYWHKQVRPAYTEVSWVWLIYFSMRMLLQIRLFAQASVGWLGIIQILSAWPATVVLLVASYGYGSWRLKRLGGPSVAEFRQGQPPPWQSQPRGF